ncbi:MAG: hypothetical protein JOZ19_15730 [Rubrobacter sp.]|nr:hypothetical protein [Rubrobacter sp.]
MMMYSPASMSGESETDIECLEKRLVELEKLAEELESAPDPKVVDILNRAVALLAEVNTNIEAGLLKAESETRMLSDLLQKVDFEPFDVALEDLKRPPDGPSSES